MTRAFLVLCGLVMVATQQTPFDLTGLHFSPNRFVELTACVLIMIGVLATAKD